MPVDNAYRGSARQPHFDEIHARYDLLNHLLSFGMDFSWRRAMSRELLHLRSGVILDLAVGTGDSAKTLVNKGCTVVGIDLSVKMLEASRGKILPSSYSTVAGSGYQLPFKHNSFDGLSCAFGIRNMHDTGSALREAFRVLKHGGKAVFLEFSMPRGMLFYPYRLYLEHIVPNIAALFSSREAYRYLAESILGFHSREDFCRLLSECGFVSCRISDLTFGTVALYTALKP